MCRSRLLAGVTAPCVLLACPVFVQTTSSSADIVVTAVPTVAEATAAIQRTPGTIKIVPDAALKETPVQALKDILRFTPGVSIQPRYRHDARVSI